MNNVTYKYIFSRVSDTPTIIISVVLNWRQHVRAAFERKCIYWVHEFQIKTCTFNNLELPQRTFDGYPHTSKSPEQRIKHTFFPETTLRRTLLSFSRPRNCKCKDTIIMIQLQSDNFNMYLKRKDYNSCLKFWWGSNDVRYMSKINSHELFAQMQMCKSWEYLGELDRSGTILSRLL